MNFRTSDRAVTDRATKDLVLERLDVVDAMRALKLPHEWERSGLWVSCPFHQEKTPSLHVEFNGEKKGQWYCFGCADPDTGKNRGGGIATLVARVLKFESPRVEGELDLDAAWKWLSRLAGVTGDEPVKIGRASPDAEPKIGRQLGMPSGTAPAWRDTDATTYLASRGVTERQARLYNLGYRADRRRIIIPSVVGGVLRTWDARSIDLICADCDKTTPAAEARERCRCGGELGDCQPKTYGAAIRDGADPQSAIFGYDLLPRDAPLIVLVEGPWGALHIARETRFSVAALRGSVLHAPQARLIARLRPHEVVVLGDGDVAGQKLAANLTELAMLVPTRSRCCPDGRQPDDHRARALHLLIAAATPAGQPAEYPVEVSCQPK